METQSAYKFLRNHKKWQPITKVKYQKYTHCIELGPYKRNIFIPRDRHDCRIVERITDYGSGRQKSKRVTKVYTNDLELIMSLAKVYKVINLQTPINQEHDDALIDPKKKFVFRTSLYYKKYKYKIEMFRNFRGFKNLSPTEYNNSVKLINKFISENFNKENSRITSSPVYAHWNHNYVTRMLSLPTIYTNNDQSAMLLKMLCDENVDMEINIVYLV